MPLPAMAEVDREQDRRERLDADRVGERPAVEAAEVRDAGDEIEHGRRGRRRRRRTRSRRSPSADRVAERRRAARAGTRQRPALRAPPPAPRPRPSPRRGARRGTRGPPSRGRWPSRRRTLSPMASACVRAVSTAPSHGTASTTSSPRQRRRRWPPRLRPATPSPHRSRSSFTVTSARAGSREPAITSCPTWPNAPPAPCPPDRSPRSHRSSPGELDTTGLRARRHAP